MANFSADSLWTKVLFIMLPAVLTPFIAWLLSLRAEARRNSELNALLRRLELVERLQKAFSATESQPGFREACDAELRDILAEFGRLRGPETPTHVLAQRTVSLPRWRSWFLVYKQASVRAGIYRALFYILVAFGVFSGIQVAALDLFEGFFSRGGLALLGGGFYVAIGLGFRAAALRDYRRRSNGPVQPATAAPAT